MKILSLDLGTHLGWATYSGKKVSCGKKVFKRDPSEGIGAMFYHFRYWLSEKIKELDPDVIVYEMPHLRGKPATFILMGMATIASELAHIYKKPIVSVHTASLKKSFCGSGKASKTDVLNEARKRINVKRKISSHEADAIALIYYILQGKQSIIGEEDGQEDNKRDKD